MVLRREPLDEAHALFVGALPSKLIPDEATFARLWAMHPPRYHRIKMHGRDVDTPRWQQAYGADYQYTGSTNRALPIPLELAPIASWCREAIDARLDGLLLNWYDAELGHYIGRHRDSRTHLCAGAPIVTLSLGAERIFRLRPWKGQGKRDFPATHGTVFVMPYATNLAWTHEVPHHKRYGGRRISVTLRAFDDVALAGDRPRRGGTTTDVAIRRR